MISVIIPNEDKSVFRIGRSHEVDIRISDISVSRLHASLKFTDNSYYIEDNDSKFGTLAMISNLNITPNISRAVQVGRTIISLNVRSVELDMYLYKLIIEI